ncbi:hypothetical protein CIK05_08935 [Bdellovibrio sp. qaytius]|nr:hypothetical protein CIK05_08935 [Bdellovibrio sp. qaytius]
MKTIIALVTLSLAVLTSAQAMATPLVCAYKDIKLDEQINKTEAKAYYKKLEKECDYTKAMGRIASDLAAIKKPMNTLNYYQGLRYVDRYAYEKARKDNIPLNVVFQIKKEDYDVPVAQRSHLVWNNWTAGINTIPQYKQALLSGEAFTVDMFLSIHKTFYTQDESGEYGQVYSPGKLKNPNTPEISWPIKDHASDIKANLDIVNQMYLELGLQPAISKDGVGFNQIIMATETDLKPSHPAYIRTHLKILANLVENMVQNIRDHRPLIWNGHVFTPIEFALFAQQTVVRIHGFYDGNGRMSRYLQDLILDMFDMPFIASGDLYADDMTSPLEDYYEKAMKSNSQQIDALESCRNNSSNFNCETIH